MVGPRDLLGGLRGALETRLGESLSSPGIGVVDFAAVVHGAEVGAQVLARSVREALVRHEPALRGVVVRVARADPLRLCLEISARVEGEPVRARVDLSPAGAPSLRVLQGS